VAEEREDKERVLREKQAVERRLEGVE